MISSVWAADSCGSARCTVTPTTMFNGRTAQARVARRAFSLGPALFEDPLTRDRFSANPIVIAPRVRLEAAILAAGDQIMMGLEETLRLKAARVVKAFKNPCEKAGVLSKSNRRGCSSCPRN